MYHYYYDSQPDESRSGPPEPCAPPPPGPEVRPPLPREGAYIRPGKRKSERGAVAVLTILSLVLGGTALAFALHGPSLRAEGYLPPQEGYEAVSAPISASAELERAPTGDGTVLQLAEDSQGEPMTFQEIYAAVNPAVVSIQAMLPQGYSQGTGIIMSESGYIITNAHVIEDSFQVDVSLADGRSFQAKLVGSDTATDLAVLKVEGKDLPTAVFGDSEQMEVGDTVVAIGNPMGEELRGTMTDGILSAISRDMEVEGNRMTLLQTTAALNTGNSGGALINDRGQVIGVTNMKLVNNSFDGATIEGLGFAIPTATVKPVVDALIAQGYVSGRPTLGVTVRGLYRQEMEQFRVDHGLLVIQLEPAADAAEKLQTGDILLSANGTELWTTDDLLAIRDELQVGDTISLEVQRDGEILQTEIRIMERYEIEDAES